MDATAKKDKKEVSGTNGKTSPNTTTTTTTTTSSSLTAVGKRNDSPTVSSSGNQSPKSMENEEDEVMEEEEEEDDTNGNENGDDEDPHPFFDDDEVEEEDNDDSTIQNGINRKDETEEARKERLESIRLEKERLKQIREQQRKQLQELEKNQRQQLQEDKEKSASARLKYLLERTEIFTHFVSNSNNSTKKTKTKSPVLSSNNSSSNNIVSSTPTKRGHITEEAEDEAIMNETMEEEEPHSFNFFTSSPPYIKSGTMRDYQVYGLNWLIQLYERGINGILADEMGLGKTLQTISLLGYLSEYKGIRGPHLIIAPKSTLSGWSKEFAKWCPFLRVVRFHGSKEEREEIKKNQLIFKKFDVCITTYEVAIREKSTFKKFSWRYIIIDEAHRIKNENSVLSKGVRMFNSQFRLLITGTPLQNNLHELWSLLNFLLPDVFSSSEDFDKWFDLANTENQQEVIDKLHKVLRPFLLRRIKTEVEKSLPPKKEIKLFVGLSTMQKEWYKRLLSKDLDAVVVGAKGNTGRVRLLNICMQLRKACNHPYLFDGAEEEPYTTGEHLIDNSGKMALLDKLLKKLKERGSRVLIFSQMSRMLDILEDYMLYRGYKYARIDGSTESLVRENSIENYNAPGSELFAFLLTTRAGGLGITLNTADIVILFDSDWNPQMDLQAQDRAHRIGQTKPVTVYRFVTENSMEEKMVEKAEMKLQLDALVIQQGRLVEANKNAKPEELLAMLRFGADDIFKSKSSTITDEDIDSILKKGEEKTEQLNSKVKDLAANPLKFQSDGNLYMFDGVNYKNTHASSGYWAETLKRERKTVAGTVAEEEAVPPKPVIKRERRFNKPKQTPIYDFQFYSSRLTQLYEKENEAYNKKVEWYDQKDKGELPEEEEEPDFGDLSKEEQDLKEKLIKTGGFGDWSKTDFRTFIRGCELYGRKAYQSIAEEVQTKTEKEVQQYSQAFWRKHSEVADHEKLIARIEKGEERIMKYKETQDSLNYKINKYKNPWVQLKIQYGLKKNKNYNDEEDIFLVCMCHRLGYGAFEELKEEIRKSPQFRFDWFIQTRTCQELKARVDQLLKYIIKEHQEEMEAAREAEKRKKEKEKLKLAAASGAASKKTDSPNKTLGKRKDVPPPSKPPAKPSKASAKSKPGPKSKAATTKPATNGRGKKKPVEEEEPMEEEEEEEEEENDEEEEVKVPLKKRQVK
ncbi:hypothetical protein RB653_003733 [Dictyostelium firmibasis]|uniref:Uncharacterized protein n=1 Tax=Dictyostelium firmibasis TaxID=79012 RepID=A0AAN7U9G9_9MYCE